MLSGKECKKQALESLKGRWTAPVTGLLIFSGLYILVYSLIIVPMFFLVHQMDKGTYGYVDDALFVVIALFVILILMLIFYVLIIVFMPVFKMGYYNVITKTSNTNENIKIKEIFSGFKMFGKSHGCFWWYTLWLMIWTYPFIFVMQIISMIISCFSIIGTTRGFNVGLLIVFLVLLTVIYGLVIFFSIKKSLQYSFMFFIVSENPKVKARAAMNISKTITKGKLWKLFVFNLSFIGWILLSIVTFGIGLLWVYPYMMVSSHKMYKTLRAEFEVPAIAAPEEPKLIE